MPIEISEIGIRLSVGEPAAAPPRAGDSDARPATGTLAPHEADELVRRCVQDVLATLRLMTDR